jgi:dTDP-4-dehydrorhamnose reductase
VRVLVTGAKGQLGVELLEVLGQDHDVVGLDLPELDITKPEATRVIADARPAWVVHAAAWTDVDGCERDPARALLVNGEGTRRVAEACRAVGAGVVYLSTDYVFDGRKGAPYVETDPVSPLSAYARSKVAGEEAVRAVAPRWAIVRTAWLFGVSGKNFVKTIVEKAAVGGPLRVVDDQVGSPTYARDLAEAIGQLVSRDLTGTYHLTNAGSCSWYAFTCAIVEEAGLAHVAVAPMTTAELGRPAPRPAISVLANPAWVASGMRPLRPWREALSAMLADWKKTDAFPSLRRS